MSNLIIAGIFGIGIILVAVSMAVLPCEMVWVGDALSKCVSIG